MGIFFSVLGTCTFSLPNCQQCAMFSENLNDLVRWFMLLILIVYLFSQVGNWSRCLTDLFGMDAEDSGKNDEDGSGDDHRKGGNQLEHFYLLNSLSDLLMLPKDMLMDRTIRMEVQPLFRQIF